MGSAAEEAGKDSISDVAKEEDWVPDESYYDTSAKQKTDKSGLTVIEKQYATLPKDVERRIYVVGAGSIGMLVAHSLRSLPEPPPVTLLFHKLKNLRTWAGSPQHITVHRDGFDIKQSGFDFELTPEVRREHGVIQPSMYEKHSRDYLRYQSQEPITNLIVATKCQTTVPAILPVKHRLSEKSTICLLQNGLGAIDELNRDVFPDPSTRPSYVQGVLTHGANVPPHIAERDPFYVVHAGLGGMSLGILPREMPLQSPSDRARSSLNQIHQQDKRWAMSARYVLRTLTRSPVLAGVGFAPTDLFLLQLEKLAVNCIINTLTVLLDARNGVVAEHFSLLRTIRLMLAEISLVIRSLPELQGLANIDTRFSAQYLESVVRSVANTTAMNISSTLADVRAGRSTEIEYMNGYIIRRGEELGIKCVVNYAMMQVVLGKANMVNQELYGHAPLSGSRARS